MLKRKRSDHWNWSPDHFEVVDNLNEATDGKNIVYPEKHEFSSDPHIEMLMGKIDSLMQSDKSKIKLAPTVKTINIKKKPPRTGKIEYDPHHHDIDHDMEMDHWGDHDHADAWKAENHPLNKKEESHHAPEGSHIMSFSHGDTTLVSFHDGKGNTGLLTADEYHKKYVPDYSKDNPVGHHYNEYKQGANKFKTIHGGDGNLVTGNASTQEPEVDFSHLRLHGNDMIGPDKPVKLYPEGSYHNPYKNNSVGAIARFDGETKIHKADYNEPSKMAKLNKKNLVHLKAHHDALTDNDKYYIKKYKEDSADTNRVLRSADDFYAHNRQKKIDEYGEKYNALDKVTSHHTVEDMHVYRGFDNTRSKRKHDEKLEPHMLKPGFTFRDHGYTGTSLSADTARSHSRTYHTSKDERDNWGDKKTRRSIFKIHLPKGTKGHYFDHEQNTFDNEQEFVLHRGSTFMVTHHSVDHDTHFVHVKVVKQEHHAPSNPVGPNMPGPKNFSKFKPSPKKLTEGKTIKDRSDHWNWSEDQVERVKEKTKLVRKDKKEKRPDRSGHWNWSENDVEEVRPPNATLHEDLHPAAGVPGPHITPMPDGSISRPHKIKGEGPTKYMEYDGIDFGTGEKVKKNNGGSRTVPDKYNREKVLEKHKVNLDHYKEHHDSLNGADKKYIGSYKKESSATNGKLRAQRDPKMTAQLKEEIAKSPKYKALDKITSHPSKEHMVVYRGYHGEISRKGYIPHTKAFGQFKKGFTFKDHGYTGTSLNAETARTHSKGSHTEGWVDGENNYSKNKKHRRAIFAIHLPKGTKGHYFDHHENEYDSEQEFVLHRGSTFKVTHHSQDDDTHFIHVKVVHQSSFHKPKLTKKSIKLLKKDAADRALTKQPELPFSQGIKKPAAKAAGLKEFLELNRALSEL